MRAIGFVAFVIGTAGISTPSLAQSRSQTGPTIKDWVAGKMDVVATKCIGPTNLKKLKKKSDLVPDALKQWQVFKVNADKSASSVVRQGTAGLYTARVFDGSSGTLVLMAGALSGDSYPPIAVAAAGARVTHVQNCMAMLAGKGNLKLSAPLLQAALDASYSNSNTQALVLDGGTIISAYAWALDDSSEVSFPSITRNEVMLDMWAWLKAHSAQASNANLKITSTMTAIEAHLTSDVRMESLLSGSLSGGGGIGFLSGNAEGSASAKVLARSTYDGFDTAVFSETFMSMPTAATLAERLQRGLQFALDPDSSKSFAGAPVQLSGKIARSPRSACQYSSWLAEDPAVVTLDKVDWDSASRACNFTVTVKPAAATTETVKIPLWLVSKIDTTGTPAIRVGLDVNLSNEAEMISFVEVRVTPPVLPAIGSAQPMPMTIAYRVREKNARELTDVTTDLVGFKCGTNTPVQIPTTQAYVSGAGNKDLFVIFDVPASAVANIAQVPVSCTVTGSVNAKIKVGSATVQQAKALPTAAFDLVRPAPPAPAPAPIP